MRYETPQFIEVEAKIVGFFTIKQFGYIAAAFVIDLILWLLFKPFVVFLIGIPITAFAAALAFIKIDGRPFSAYLLKALSFMFKPKTYVWKKREEDI